MVAEYGRISSAVGQASSSLNLTESRAAVYGLDLTVRREDSDALLLSAFRKVVKWVILTRVAELKMLRGCKLWRTVDRVLGKNGEAEGDVSNHVFLG